MSRLLYKGTEYSGFPSNAEAVAYDNTDSVLESTNVQDAIDELAEGGIGGAGVVETTLEDYMAHKAEYDASDNIIAIADADGVESLDIMYDNTTSGLEATNMQDAIDELASEKQDASTAITTANISSQSVSHASTADTATSATSATSAGSATNDGNGNNIVNTYQTKSGAITTANISSQSVASATKATQDGSGNVITSTYETKANVTSKGSNTQPVYFDANGVAQPISQTIGNVAGLSYQVVSTWT